MTSKSQLRKWAKEQRKAIGEKRLTQASAALCAAVADTQAYRRAPVLLVYAALWGELDLSALASRALGDGKIVAYPRCGQKGQMSFFPVRGEEDLVPGRYGIREPREGLTPLTNLLPDTLCVVPALTFDKAGHRIGYGGGYYDRFLAAHPCVTLGGCLRELYVEQVPAENTDIPVDTVLLV